MIGFVAGDGMAYGVALVFVFAAVIVVVGVVGLMLKLGSAVVRGFFGPSHPAAVLGYHVCAVKGCGQNNRPGARYCAQCGARLGYEDRVQR